MFYISKIDDISVLHLYGEVGLLEIEFIEKMILSLKRFHHTKILLDLARVDYLHFKAVSQWATHAADLQNKAGDLKLLQPNQQTQYLLKFTGADQYLKDYSSLADGVLSFLKDPAQFEAREQIMGKGPHHKAREKNVSQKNERGGPQIRFH